jgi:hypothetical protein
MLCRTTFRLLGVAGVIAAEETVEIDGVGDPERLHIDLAEAGKSVVFLTGGAFSVSPGGSVRAPDSDRDLPTAGGTAWPTTPL